MSTRQYPIRGTKFAHLIEVEAVLADVQSEFQHIEIIRNPCFGKMLLLDGHIQLSELDEHLYHQALVHPLAADLPEGARALVIGGGDGGVIRELCRFPEIAHIDMIEIDAEVITQCRAHMPELGDQAWDDPRLNLQIDDAFARVKGNLGPYDLIVADSTDVYEDESGELSEQLFTEALYQRLNELLTPGGRVVTQADNPVFCPYSVEAVSEMLGKVFRESGAYANFVPSFGGSSAYVWGGNRPLAQGDAYEKWVANADQFLRLPSRLR